MLLKSAPESKQWKSRHLTKSVVSRGKKHFGFYDLYATAALLDCFYMSPPPFCIVFWLKASRDVVCNLPQELVISINWYLSISFFKKIKETLIFKVGSLGFYWKQSKR